MAKEYGVEAGEEMMTAINYAKSHQLPVAFIDMNAQFMFSKMLKSMTFSEKIITCKCSSLCFSKEGCSEQSNRSHVPQYRDSTKRWKIA